MKLLSLWQVEGDAGKTPGAHLNKLQRNKLETELMLILVLPALWGRVLKGKNSPVFLFESTTACYTSGYQLCKDFSTPRNSPTVQLTQTRCPTNLT